MLASANPPRRFSCAWLLALLHAVSVPAQVHAQSPRSVALAPPARSCGCADGRRFAIGASMFGKDSARVVITGFRPDLPAGSKSSPCIDLQVLGQVIQPAKAQDGRPFLKRQSLRRGIIHDICETKIQFVQASKQYDFFADDGNAIVLSEKDAAPPSIAEEPTGRGGSVQDEIELNEDLTGKDLLQLTRTKAFSRSAPIRPEDAAFDSEDLKEGAYLICRRRTKATLVANTGLQRVSANSMAADKPEISVLAGTLGRIEKRAGFRSEPLWVVEILPDSAPLPFLRSLISFPRGLGGPREPALPREVILASSDVVEINQFLDRSGVEWTRLGDASDAGTETGTAGLSMLYTRPFMPLEENLTVAERSGMLAAVQSATRGFRLIFKNPKLIAERRTLVFDERAVHAAYGDAAPDFLRRQCFLGMDSLGRSQYTAAEGSMRPALFVTGADIRIFRPGDWSQVG